MRVIYRLLRKLYNNSTRILILFVYLYVALFSLRRMADVEADVVAFGVAFPVL